MGHGCTVADLIFPCFLFIVGVTAVFFLEKRLKSGESYPQLYRHILWRSASLFLLGLLACSWFLFGWLFQVICPPAETQKSIWAIFLSPPLFAYVGAQIGVIALGTLYIGTVTHHTHLNALILKTLFGTDWNIVGESHWRNPSWPSLSWALLYLSIWTLLAGLLYRRRFFFKI